MPRRLTYEVRWMKGYRLWGIFRGRNRVSAKTYKNEAILQARKMAMGDWELRGIPTELVIKNLDGQIGSSREARSTYGLDPEKSVG